MNKTNAGIRRKDIRNIAIVAHVDHGKTTLVDTLLRQTGEFKVKPDEVQECVLDSNPQERERGITILAKCTSVPYKGHTINIVDTPGHADFGSEVERILKMVDGVLLLVDAADGPMPQTRFVLRKSLELGLHPIVVINKVDRPFADPHKALDATFGLFVDLGAADSQLDFPIVYASGRQGWATLDIAKPATDLSALFEVILKYVPGPLAEAEKPLQMLTTMVDYDSYVGRIAIGRISNGHVAKGQTVNLVKADGLIMPYRVTKLYGFFGLQRREIERAAAGDIVAVAGVEDAQVGDTVADAEAPQGLPPLEIDEPTLAVEILVNDSPFAGRDGKFLTSRHIRSRLEQEKRTNVGLRIEEIGSQGTFKVSGRGELHLSVMIETLRREGYELAVSRPEVIDKVEKDLILEPAESLILDIVREHQGVVIENMGRRGAQLKNMALEGENRMRIECVITARGLLGFKSEFMTQTKGTGLMHHSFYGYIPKTADAPARRLCGVLVAKEPGTTASYALESLQERAVMFFGAGEEVYQGMIVGMSAREHDMLVNPCKKKPLTNMRASGSDDTIQLTPPRILTLEQAIEFIADDELVEVTPRFIRLRKKNLKYSARKRENESLPPQS